MGLILDRVGEDLADNFPDVQGGHAVSREVGVQHLRIDGPNLARVGAEELIVEHLTELVDEVLLGVGGLPASDLEPQPGPEVEKRARSGNKGSILEAMSRSLRG